MKRICLRVIALLVCAGGVFVPARAHSMYQGAILLDFHGTSADVELQLPLERVETALGRRSSPPNIERALLRNFSASLPDGAAFRVDPIDSPHLSSIEGAPYVVAHLRLTPSAGENADLFDLRCNILLDRIPAQVFLVSVRTDWQTSTFANDPRLVAVIRDGERSVRIDRREGNWWRGFASVFRLGMQHIAEGTDHLLFLLALLLPAPLLLRNGTWAGPVSVRLCLLRIGAVVTAFTVGHSVTLAVGALKVIHVPGRPIEVLIAVSILVSAAHALRPLFPGREAVIAGCFGLVHGMAFAGTLAELGLGPMGSRREHSRVQSRNRGDATGGRGSCSSASDSAQPHAAVSVDQNYRRSFCGMRSRGVGGAARLESSQSSRRFRRSARATRRVDRTRSDTAGSLRSEVAGFKNTFGIQVNES